MTDAAPSRRPPPSPLVVAISLSLMAFVGFMALVVSIVAFSVAGRQGGHGGAIPDGVAEVTSYALAIGLLLDAYVIMRRGRGRPAVVWTCTALFALATVGTCALFTRAW